MKRFVSLLFSMFLLCSCIGDDLTAPEYMLGGGKNQSARKETGLKDCTIDQVALKSFKIKSSLNQQVYINILFTSEDGIHYEGIVKDYLLSDLNLVPSWNCVAAKVTVDGVEQVSESSVVDFSKEVTYRFHSSDGQYKELSFAIRQGDCSDMAIVSLETPEGASLSKGAWTPGYIKVYSPDNGTLSMDMSIKHRGNNSNGQKKKSYTVKLSERSKVLGMKKHKRWTLIANAADRTLLRNRVAYEIANRTELAWAPHTRFCELYLNGQYAGLYLIVEQIRVDKNRVNITEILPGSDPQETLTGGYLLECDRYDDELSFKTAVRELPINIKSPDEDAITPAHIEYIQNYFKKIEQLLYQEETPDPEYRKYIDMASFADVWIILELTNCKDATIPGSVYYYKDKDGPLCAGPVWDFDLSTFTGSRKFLLYDYEVTDFGAKKERSLWYSRLFRDDEFRALVKERWQSYLPAFRSIPDYIDEQAAMMEKAADRNFEIWTANGWNKDENLSWKDAVALMKENYLIRLNALNDQISTW